MPGDPNYPLKMFFDKLKLWYRISTVEDEAVGPLVAGRLYGRASTVAMNLKVPRPDGQVDTGDQALIRLSVDEVRDPTTGAIIQHHIPSGIQFLINALRAAFGQADQDLATVALDRFFGLHRGRLSLQEYAVEFDTRLDEAQDRAGLQLNEVAKYYLWFKNSGINAKTIDDIKLQVQGDYNRFQDARTLALRMSPTHGHAAGEDTTSFWADRDDWSWYEDPDMFYYGGDAEHGEWIWDDGEHEETYYQDYTNHDYESYEYQDHDHGYDEGNYDDGGWYWDQETGYDDKAAEMTPDDSKRSPEEATEESYFKGKGKGKHDGCFICGSKWHMARDCPMKGKSKGKQKGESDHHLTNHYKGKGKGKPKGNFRGGWRWRPKGFGSKGFGSSGYGGYGGYGRKGKGYGKGKRHHWFAGSSKSLTFKDGSDPTHRETSSAPIESKPSVAERFNIYTDSEEDLMKTTRTTHSRQVSHSETQEDFKSDRRNKTFTLNFTTFHAERVDVYHQVRGRERHGLLIDPGAASGLVGSDTLRLLQPFMTTEPVLDREKTTPVSGISGSSESTLGQVTLSFSVAGTSLTYTAEVLGGEGSTCPALVGNPALRKLGASLLTQWFSDGDGLLVVRHPGHGDEPLENLQFFRLLLTDSGHYILPLDDKGKQAVDRGEKLRALQLFHHVASSTSRPWYDVEQDVRHCFLVQTTGSDRSDQAMKDQQPSTSPTSTVCSSRDRGHDKQVRFQETNTEGDGGETSAEAGPAVLEDDGTRDQKHHEPSNSADGYETTDRGDQSQTDHDKHYDVQGAFASEVRHLTYAGDQLPSSVDARKLERRYKAIPEEFHTKSGLMPVTPDNFRSWFGPLRGRGLRWHFWEIFSGSGRLSLTLLMAGLLVGFPVDFRYGWNLCDPGHQAMLMEAYSEFQPGVVHCAPDCAPWSVSSNQKDPATRMAERIRDKPALQFVQRICELQSQHGRVYSVEQPMSSAMWQSRPENPLQLERLPDHRARQRIDQCMHGARDENGYPIQKPTALGSNAKWKMTSKRCSHDGGHSRLQGAGPSGLPRTAQAAVYPKGMCQAMRQDVVRFLHRLGLLASRPWPAEAYTTTLTHFYECVRCQLGRACPPGIEHTLIPGQCRHGKWPEGMGPRHKRPVEQLDPVVAWKDRVGKEAVQAITFSNQTDIPLDDLTVHLMKKLFLETVTLCLRLFNDTSGERIEYFHFLENPLLLGLYKDLFKGFLSVQGVRAEIRPFALCTAEPVLARASSYMRLCIQGSVKSWTLRPLEDLRMLSFNQIHTDIDDQDIHWGITLYGREATVVAPSTPAARPRAIPAQPPLEKKEGWDESAPVPPNPGGPASGSRGDGALGRAAIYERPDDPHADDVLRAEPYEADLEVRPAGELQPVLRPNYSLKRVFQRLPKLVENEDYAKAKQLLLGLHERLWHSPIGDFCNLLKKANMDQKIIELAVEAVKQCAICRKYVRLPNRPQTRARGANYFNENVQMDLFKWEDTWFMLLIDEASRFKVCCTIDGQDYEKLLTAFMRHWIYIFGPPKNLVLDQQVALMGHEAAVEFERLSIARAPRGTTQGHGADQHTGTGIVERHVGLIKLTMYKLRAELHRQGLQPTHEELGQESAMAHNLTLSYGGVTPSMIVFGTLPHELYHPESEGVMSITGATQRSGLTVFERALRIRQTALAQAHQAVIEDRAARAARTRPHQLDIGKLVQGTSEVEFYREVKQEPGWRGPALLLRLDADEGVAIIQYQGKPYLVSLRHIRPYQGIYHFTLPDEDTEKALTQIMRYTESLTEHKVYTYGWFRRGSNWTRFPRDEYLADKILQWTETIYKGMSKNRPHGALLGRSLKSLKPPQGTIGHLILWITGGRGFSVQEHRGDGFLKLKRVSNYDRDELCMLYCCSTSSTTRISTQNQVPVQ